MADTGRIDKYLWSIRVYKTRTDASVACKGNKVKINGITVKPSKVIKQGDVISIRKGAAQFTYKVIKLLENRVGASLVSEYAENLTSQSEIDKLRSPVETIFIKRDRGAGRPTKKDRREIDELYSEMEMPDYEEIPDDIALHFGITEEDEL